MNVNKIVAQNLINISIWLHSLKSQFDILKKKIALQSKVYETV